MNIKVISLMYRCRHEFRHISDCPYLEYMAGGEDMRNKVCDKFEPCGNACKYLEPVEKVEVKQIKKIELVKDSCGGYARIGRTVYELKDVILLQVDYGDGFVTEWTDNSGLNDRISHMQGKRVKNSVDIESLLDFKSAVKGVKP